MRPWILLLAFWPLVATALIEVAPKTSHPGVDQPFRIRYSARGERLAAPDLTPLRRDFRILGRRMRRSNAVRLQVASVEPVADENPGGLDGLPWPGHPDPFGMAGMPMEVPQASMPGPTPAQGSPWPPAGGPATIALPPSPMPHPLRKVRYDSGLWPWIAAFACTGWIATALAWWLSGRRRRLRSKTAPAGAGTEALASRISRAATTGDPEETRRALMQWGRVRWSESPPSNLRLLAARCPPLLQTHLLRLDNALSRAGGAGWSDPDLGDLIARFERGEP